METNKKIALFILLILSIILLFRRIVWLFKEVISSFEVFLFGVWVGSVMIMVMPDVTEEVLKKSPNPLSTIKVKDDNITVPLPRIPRLESNMIDTQ